MPRARKEKNQIAQIIDQLDLNVFFQVHDIHLNHVPESALAMTVLLLQSTRKKSSEYSKNACLGPYPIRWQWTSRESFQTYSQHLSTQRVMSLLSSK